jgi:tetratricopeptide (TPR) repeat protein
VASDYTSQLSHTALAEVHFFQHELDAFLPEAERAIALNPSNADVLGTLGQRFYFAGNEQGIAFVRKAMKLDPFHPPWFYFTIADRHFDKGEYEEALAEAQKINIPGFFWVPVFLAAIYAELGRESEARSALEDLFRLYPGFATRNLIEEWRKWNRPDDTVRRWVAALRKAGLKE